ncbi:TPR-like protein [Sparassis crispa]|uniref:TPR-like protein n=1 Tax=Sparassis crispa TaxID=139825 RepID=A0A401H400_9APHY|nr:TPR-like protein [Sparassis crispa]GBE89142.1 TPR-like protein [Sparassis crispa]
MMPNLSGLKDIMDNPEGLQRLLDMVQHDAMDAEARGETFQERMMRERAEWTETDDRVKEQGNQAFRAGDFRRAYLCYTGVIDVSCHWHDAAYWLNRAAVCLKLNAYACAEDDANMAWQRKPSAKALYRRGQARRFLGRLAEAERDLSDALRMESSNKALADELALIQFLRTKSDEELQEWLAENKGVDRPLSGVSDEDLRELAAKMYKECQPPGWQMRI